MFGIGVHLVLCSQFENNKYAFAKKKKKKSKGVCVCACERERRHFPTFDIISAIPFEGKVVRIPFPRKKTLKIYT